MAAFYPSLNVCLWGATPQGLPLSPPHLCDDKGREALAVLLNHTELVPGFVRTFKDKRPSWRSPPSWRPGTDVPGSDFRGVFRFRRPCTSIMSHNVTCPRSDGLVTRRMLRRALRPCSPPAAPRPAPPTPLTCMMDCSSWILVFSISFSRSSSSTCSFLGRFSMSFFSFRDWFRSSLHSSSILFSRCFSWSIWGTRGRRGDGGWWGHPGEAAPLPAPRSCGHDRPPLSFQAVAQRGSEKPVPVRQATTSGVAMAPDSFTETSCQSSPCP